MGLKYFILCTDPVKGALTLPFCKNICRRGAGTQRYACNVTLWVRFPLGGLNHNLIIFLFRTLVTYHTQYLNTRQRGIYLPCYRRDTVVLILCEPIKIKLILNIYPAYPAVCGIQREANLFIYQRACAASPALHPQG